MRTALPFLIAIVLFTSCTKKDEVICDARKSGYLQVKVIPTLNGQPVYSGPSNPVQVMIALDYSESRGNNPASYDRIIKARANESWISCNNINCGIYYFRVRMDETSSGKIFSGGTSLVTQQREGTIELPVSISQE